MKICIREANEVDFPEILKLIKQLADYEKCLDEVEVTNQTMLKDRSYFNAIVAEYNNKIIGTAIYFPYYSTWKGRCIYLEDLIVTEKFRNLGIGKKLIVEIVKIAKTFGAKRVMWQVLDWNEIAIKFYKKINTELDDTWINCKLTTEQINNFK